VPAQNRVRPHDARYPIQGALAETLSDVGQCPPFAIGQAHATLELISKSEELVSEEELGSVLIDVRNGEPVINEPTCPSSL